MERANRRRVALAALALAAPLMLSSSTTESAAGEAREEASRAPLACEAPATAVFDRRIEGEIARRAAGGGQPADSDIVVLNGRGYNYGPAEPNSLDRIQLETLMTRVEIERR
jgi:hypothetical protein